MPVIADDAIVLARLDYSETSQILVLFTREHGKVRAIAKGIKRSTKTRFAAGIDLLDVGRIVVSSRQERSAHLATLTEWKQTRSLSGLREKLHRIQGAQYTAEVTAHLTEDWDPHVELFEGFLSTLVELSEASEPLGPVVAYQLRLVEAIGSLPRFDICVQCGRPQDLSHFSSLDGGMICRNCEPRKVEKWEVTPAILDTVMVWAERGPGPVPITARDKARGSLGGAFAVLNYHIAHLMGRQPRLAPRLLTRAQGRPVQ